MAAVGLIAAACGSDEKGSATAEPDAADSSTATTTPETSTVAAKIDFSSPSGIDGADEEFNYSAMR